MKKFFDMLYFGGYYVNILLDSTTEYLVYIPLRKLLYLLGYIPFFRRNALRQGKTFKQLVDDSLKSTKIIFRTDATNFYHLLTGWLFGPMACGFWIDLAIIPFLIFERNILPYPFKGVNLIYFAAAFGIISFLLLMGGDERSERVVKEYRKKPQKEQRKAFYLFIGMYILVAFPIILFFFYAKRVGGW